ncbi:alpha/beta hydrolase [Mesorhizobium sp. VK23B]|uniref:Alpha/beta hydrolase n=1 Tax=Mesorhizobium dulcispinae TaxID=3072316 RepID=A0ABU4XPJ3_9HYPH|nr:MULTISPECIES: alpha/beta hydrolase [unclassified Mesorhizobium]MDX8470280.1 alpha/beta hydrolase [Mesorhizobium sp. VK23B]MDX8476665.1 alpha/beta hydrolase [Mesorhizobium sp. VK23A]
MSRAGEKLAPAYAEHRIASEGGRLFVRDYAGEGPAFVMLHGFPDNGHIFDELIPHLVAGGRRAVVFDFLGFGDSDKPPLAAYSFAQQLGDLEAVVAALGLDKIVPVGHDAGGPAAINFALRHPGQVAEICLMNAFYSYAPSLRFPEFIELFATKSQKDLTTHFLRSPPQFAWLLSFQRRQMQANMTATQIAHYNAFLGPIIEKNFANGAGAAFAQMTFQLFDEVEANQQRLPDFRRLDVPVKLIWGGDDAYLNVGVAEDIAAQAKHAVLHRLEAGHWPQIDEPRKAAALMLAD